MSSGWRKRQIMDKKILMKIRLRPDGTWEHVYDDGSTDQEFYRTTADELADLKSMRENKLKQFHALNEMAEHLVEMALDLSELKEAKSVLTHIMSKR